MALKNDAEQVADMAIRIATIISRSQAFQQQGSVLIDENPDLTIAVNAQTRQEWADKVSLLQGKIKTIVTRW